MAQVAAVTTESGEVVCEKCVLAYSPPARIRGLLGRRELPGEEGVLLRPAGSIHTFFMRFAIDVVFLDRELRVLRVAANVRPWRAVGQRRARAVLELRSGEAARRGLATGDLLEIEAEAA